MASKRQTNMIDYDQTSSDEEDYMLVDSHEPDELIAQQNGAARPGRPRKPSLTNTNSSETICAAGTLPARRRGRGPSKRPCLNRNALMARENRQRKKEYIERIEAKLQTYQTENQELTSTIAKQNNEIKRLNTEVAYLRGVLNNQTTITTLLKSMNDSLGRIHPIKAATTDATAQQPNAGPTVVTGNNGITKASSDVINWIVSGQTNSSKTNNLTMPFSGKTMRTSLEGLRDDSRRLSYGQQATNNPVKIARKTMPFTTQNTMKTEDPSSVESIFEDEDRNIPKSPHSGSFCDYNIDKGSLGNDNQQPTTPMSALSNSMDKAEASLSNTDFSQLSTLNVDNLFDNLDDGVNPLQFEQADLFDDDTLFHSLDKEQNAQAYKVIDPLEISKMSEAINEKENNSLFDNFDNAGVCLHINSSRVSLEYCSICHFKNMNSEIASN